MLHAVRCAVAHAMRCADAHAMRRVGVRCRCNACAHLHVASCKLQRMCTFARCNTCHTLLQCALAHLRVCKVSRIQMSIRICTSAHCNAFACLCVAIHPIASLPIYRFARLRICTFTDLHIYTLQRTSLKICALPLECTSCAFQWHCAFAHLHIAMHVSTFYIAMHVCKFANRQRHRRC